MNTATTNSTIDLGNNETLSRGVFPQADGTWLALTFTKSRTFKTERGRVAGSGVVMIDPCAFACSECGDDSPVPLETVDIKDGEHGPKAYRPCARCLAERADTLPAGDVDAILNVAIGSDLVAMGAS